MSQEANSTEPRYLFDTCFILPTLGINVEKIFKEDFENFADARLIYYSPLSILESLWVAARTMRDKTFDPERFKLGLRSIIEGRRYMKVEETSEIISEALKLYEGASGHKDMIDNILCASALHYGLTMVTVDEELRKFASENLKGLDILPFSL